MSNGMIDFPHPILSEGSNDFVDGSFSIEILEWEDGDDSINLEVSYELCSLGLEKLLDEGLAQVILRITCARTSYRRAQTLDSPESTKITIPKEKISDSIDIQGIVIAADEIPGYSLEEFNKNYFGTMVFHPRKGDMLAKEPGMRIKLRSLLERDPASVITVAEDKKASVIKAYYPRTDETNTTLADYITIFLPTAEYLGYTKLRTKKYYKHGIERFLQCAVVMPALVEGISLLRAEEQTELEDEGSTYRGTVWADAIYEALSRDGVDTLDDEPNSSCYELANAILGNVEGDAISNLKQKLDEWSEIGTEDEVL